ncbi:MAG: prolyl oligopeptidase family serine peptidase [Ardenticatenales bacterium]
MHAPLPYGTWPSPLTAALVASGARGITDVVVDGEAVYWGETRPAEGGRVTIMRRAIRSIDAGGTATQDDAVELLPAPWNVRTRVHEYGGGAFTVADGMLYFSQFGDQRLYRLRVTPASHASPTSPSTTASSAAPASSAPPAPLPIGAANGSAAGVDADGPTPLTHEGPWRYADAVVDHARGRLICVREDHSPEAADAAGQARNEVVAIHLGTGAARVLATGADFYAAPRLSPAGDRLCWLAWSHPNMPWDGTELWLAEWTPDGTVTHARRVAGGPDESIVSPLWAPDGTLCFASDRSGWWNLYRLDVGDVGVVGVVGDVGDVGDVGGADDSPDRGDGGANGDGIDGAAALWPMDAEFGQPPWQFGGASFGFDGDDIVAAYGPAGARRLGRIEGAGGQTSTYALGFTELGSVRVAGGRAFMVAASPTAGSALVAVRLDGGDASEAPVAPEVAVVRRPSDLTIDPDLVSVPETIAFPTTGGREAYAFYYRPHNPSADAPAGERPPLIVISHGGPTGSASTGLSAAIQFWTSRGFALLDVNYGGSTGYGRAYRNRLDGAWGIVDVDDCVNGARFLAARGDVDADRLVIRGGSAGGYTTLCALAFHEVFAAGASHYGVGDLEALAKDTHKFESRYMDRLIGPYPERRDVYIERSPIHHIDALECPIIFFQGLEDKVVPPAQAESMVAALEAKGIPVEYVPFEGEQHGFRRAENIAAALEAELSFYGRVLGFEPSA